MLYGIDYSAGWPNFGGKVSWRLFGRDVLGTDLMTVNYKRDVFFLNTHASRIVYTSNFTRNLTINIRTLVFLRILITEPGIV